ncbi:hypothetical protein [Aeromonas jandaei]|uniref:hypothetical protein n=1 Tax=Aeromonas jandaei TaxID=650 RepID=UPI002AA0D6FD|nr:hypothetical protein [Aeromonas jandaei]
MAIRMIWFGLIAAGIILQVSNAYAAKDTGEGSIKVTANIVADSCALDSDSNGDMSVILSNVSTKDITDATGDGYQFKNINKSFVFNCSAKRAKLTSVPLSHACKTQAGNYSCGLMNPTVGVMPVLSVGDNKKIKLTGDVVTDTLDVVNGKATVSVESVYAAKLSSGISVSPGNVLVQYQITVWNF